MSFIQDGFGLVGWGEYASLTVTGSDAAATIERWYHEQLAAIDVRDDMGGPGSGPLCFVSLGFSPTDPSVAIIPRTVLSRRRADDLWFMTRITDDERGDDTADSATPISAPGAVSWADAELSATGFTAAIIAAMSRIQAGDAEKIVIAHGLDAETQFDVDERYLLTRLAAHYPSCVTFAVAGLVGASPETLVRRTGAEVFSRVLAGTVWPGRTDTSGGNVAGDPGADLSNDAKQRSEHAFSVRSVADVLGPLTSTLTVPDTPSVLTLANLTHLATDVSGTLVSGSGSSPSALAIAAALHPTAAVGGTPREVAQRIISELEPSPRGRYASPAGWMDARGDGEFVIALRCAQVSGRSVRLMAGCGIVADSDPEIETREAQVKMIPVRDALEGTNEALVRC